MALLGLLLILASGALAAGIVLGTTADTSMQVAWFDQTTRSLTESGLFGLGAAAGAALMLGLSLLKIGAARGRRRRVERKRAAAEHREQAQQLEERNAELEQKLAQTRSAAERRDKVSAATPYPDDPSLSGDRMDAEPVPATGRHRKR